MNKSQIKRLGLYINSELVESKKEIQQIRQLFKYLSKFYPKFTSKKLNKEVVFSEIYQEPTADINKANRLNGRLLSIVKYFIQNLDEGSDFISKYFNETKIYIQNKNEKLFYQTINQVKKINKNDYPHKSFFFNEYLIEHEITEFKNLYNQRKGDLNFVSTLEKLDQFYYSKRLELILDLLAQDKFSSQLDISDPIEFHNLIGDLFKDRLSSTNPIFKIYEEAITMFKSNDGEAYEKLIKLLSKHSHLITKEQNQAMHALARNFCIAQYNKGHLEYLPKAFKRFQHDLEHGYLYYQGGILMSTMQAIVKLGLRCGKQKWVGKFLEAHKDKLIGTRDPEAIFNLNMAELRFSQKKYEDCLDLIEDNFEDIHYKISSKRLEIKAYYETNSPLLESRINAFKIYIFRTSDKVIPKTPRIGNNLFIDILKQISNPSSFKNESRIKKIKSKIDQAKSLADRQWLDEKLEELK
ncbi:MAG: hypothetical protein HKO66_05265 [Saprospiraceae bacterium]|nr:hypothetical protein [Bacteroidia bacterium]NNL91617.1 hypothetical protein [Saprospiraceae bacterium]